MAEYLETDDRPDDWEYVPPGDDFGHRFELRISWDATTEIDALLSAMVIAAYARKLNLDGYVAELHNHAEVQS